MPALLNAALDAAQPAGIYNNKRIKIYMNSSLMVDCHNRQLSLQLTKVGSRWPILKPKPVESLNGIHFEEIHPQHNHIESNKSYITVCKIMRKIRISCTTLYLSINTSKDECEKYVEALKPSAIYVCTGYRRQREGFLHATSCDGVRNVKMSIAHSELQKMMELLLSTKYLERIQVSAVVPLDDPQKQLSLYLSVLKLLRSREDLRYFRLAGRWLHPMPPIEEILNKIWALNPIVEEINDGGFVLKCNIGSSGKVCKFSIGERDELSKAIRIRFYETTDDLKYMSVYR